MAAPKTGRVFLRSHGDCFIHATAFFVKYWNFSLAQEGLGIVQVTIHEPREQVFLACISPTPLPYEHVKKGMNHRRYLEIDPRFAAELGIAHDSEVVLEPVRSIERCTRFKVAPKNPADFDILYNNIEKINFELADKIRVVSCQVFFTFPVWINQDVVPVRVVNSIPSANWVMIMPDATTMELCRSGGVESDGDSTSGGATTDTILTPPDQPDEDTPFLASSMNSYLSAGFAPKESRSKSSASAASAESSVDTEATDNWNFSSMLTNATRRLLSISGLRESSGGIQETRETIEEGEDEVIRTEPGKHLRDSRFLQYPFQSEEGLTMNNKELVNYELKDKFASSLCVRGSNLTPEPIIPASPHHRGAAEPSHKRTSSVPISRQRVAGNPRATSGNRLVAYISTPRMHANLRVQPHPLKGLRPAYTKPSSKDNNSHQNQLWPHQRVFDVFVHPSTLPEVYHYLQRKSSGGAFLVEATPISQPNKYVAKNTESATKSESASLDGSNNGEGGVSHRQDTGLPPSLVVHLYFATQVTLQGDNMSASVITPPGERGTRSEDPVPQAERRTGGEDPCMSMPRGKRGTGSEDPHVTVPVRVGQVLMSDLVRRQLELKECARVKLLHVMDGWRMSFVDGIKVVIQPMNYERSNYKQLLGSFREWVKLVSDVSKFGAVLVNKQVITLKDDAGEWVNCQLKVTSGRLVPRSEPRIVFCLLTPSDFARNRVSVLVDSVSNRSSRNYRHPRNREEEPNQPLKLPDMSLLNQPVITTATPSDYGAFRELLSQGSTHLRTVFSGHKRCGTLLVCGLSGSAGVGCGKTSLVNLLAREAQGPPYHACVQVVNCTYLRSQTTSRTRKRLLSLFSEAVQSEPSLLVLEDLDHALPLVSDAQEQVQEEGNNSANKTQLLRDLLRSVRQQAARVLLVATARNRQALNRELLTAPGTHTFDKVLEIQPPSMDDRKEIVEAILRRKGIPSFTESDLRAVASRTEGFQAGDLVTLIDRAVSHSELRVLCPAHSTPFDTPPDYRCRRMSIESGSDLSLSLELSSSPQKASSGFLQKALDLSTPTQVDSGISSPAMQQAKKLSTSLTPTITTPTSRERAVPIQIKKLSVVSASSLTPTNTPKSFERFGLDRAGLERYGLDRAGLPPMTRVGSLSQMVLTVNDFVTALDGFVPASLRGLPLHKPGNVDFSHVGGLEKTKQALRETLLWPSKYPKLFSQCTIKQRCGVLLYGAPGTGKTLLAGAVAKEFALNFVSVKGPELLSKYIGASEKAVRDIFTRAQSARPCILFFDEFDSLAPRRGHDNTGVTDRVVNQLLTQLDGVETLQGVYVLAASSRPDLIDPALLRPGRIDIKLFCSMPDENERYEILRSLSKEVQTSVDVNLRELARPCHTEHFTGADLKALLYNAQLQAVHAALEGGGRGRKGSLESSPRVPVKADSPDSFGRFMAAPMVFSWSEEEGGVKQHPTVPQGTQQKVSALMSRRRRSMVGTSTGTDSEHGRSVVGTPVASNADAMERSSSFSRKMLRGQQVVVTQEVLLEAVGGVRPSVSGPERSKYSKIYDQFLGKPADTDKETQLLNLIQQKVTHA